MLNIQKIIDYLERRGISEEHLITSAGLSSFSLADSQSSLSAEDYLALCSFLGVNPWTFYERELSEEGSDL